MGRLRGAPLPAPARSRSGLPLNPDGLPPSSPHISMNTTASFVSNTNWQYYGGETTMSYLSQMAGLAVQNFVSAALGMAVLAAFIRGFARRSRDDARQLLGRPLPLARLHPAAAAVVVAVVLDLAGRRPDLRRRRDGDDARGRRAADRARAGGLAGRDQAARDERRRLLQLELGRPVREPERVHELPRDARHPAHPGRAGLHVRADGRARAGRRCRSSARCSPCSRSASRSRCRRSSTARRCCATPA